MLFGGVPFLHHLVASLELEPRVLCCSLFSNSCVRPELHTECCGITLVISPLWCPFRHHRVLGPSVIWPEVWHFGFPRLPYNRCDCQGVRRQKERNEQQRFALYSLSRTSDHTKNFPLGFRNMSSQRCYCNCAIMWGRGCRDGKAVTPKEFSQSLTLRSPLSQFLDWR